MKEQEIQTDRKGQLMIPTYVKKQGTLYVIEHHIGNNAKETVSAKLLKLILRDSMQLPHGKLRGSISLDFLFDFFASACKNICNAWRLSERRQHEKTIFKKYK